MIRKIMLCSLLILSINKVYAQTNISDPMNAVVEPNVIGDKHFTPVYLVEGTVIRTKTYDPPLLLTGFFQGERLTYEGKIKAYLRYEGTDRFPISPNTPYFGYTFRTTNHWTVFSNTTFNQIKINDIFYAAIQFAVHDGGAISNRGIYLTYRKGD